MKKISEHVPVITIDGPGGTGKGTLGRLLASALQWHFLDSGAVYRVLAYAVLREGLQLDQIDAIDTLALTLPVEFGFREGHWQVIYHDHDITHELSTEKIGTLASILAAIPEVRAALLERQRAFAKAPGLVTDGRDMGTVVFPNADLKIYLDASPQVRAKRRFNQLKERGINVNLTEILEELAARDARDSQREIAPMRPAPDAVVIDSSDQDVAAVLEQVLQLVKQRF